MVATVGIQAPQADAMTVVKSITVAMKSPASQVMSVYNLRTKSLAATVTQVMVPYRKIAAGIAATQSYTLAVVRGKIDNPKLRSWTFTLDDHDFWVLKLGTYKKTLVYDLLTGCWSWWNSDTDATWRASVGLNWRSSGSVPYNNGSNIVVGDDSTGTLWVLDPLAPVDDDVTTTDVHTFQRIATGQIPTSGRTWVPVYEVDLSCSLGQPASTASSVTMTYSDDQGATYTTAVEPMSVTIGDYNQLFQWRSLGRFRSPGRIVRIIDDGAFARIDNMTINGEVGD